MAFLIAGFSTGKRTFDTPVKVTRHQIGTAEIYLLISTVMEIIDPGMLEESAYDRTDGDILADTGNSRAEAADPPHLQLHLYAGLGCPV